MAILLFRVMFLMVTGEKSIGMDEQIKGQYIKNLNIQVAAISVLFKQIPAETINRPGIS